MNKWASGFSVGILSGILFCGIALFFQSAIQDFVRSKRFIKGTIATFPVSKDMKYGDINDPVLFIEGTGHGYSVRISRTSDPGDYFHEFPIDFYPLGADIRREIQDCKVVWTDAGVEIATPYGHKIFFPKKSFLGGR